MNTGFSFFTEIFKSVSKCRFVLFCLLDWTIEEQASFKTFLESVIMSVTVCGAASGKCDLYSIKHTNINTTKAFETQG